MSYDDIIDSNVRRLQRSIGTRADGAWGKSSQKDLIKTGYKIDINYPIVKKLTGSLSNSKFEGYQTIIKAINDSAGDAINPLYAAYILATIYHETDQKMQPIAEYGKGSKRRYGKWFVNSKGEEYGHANHRGDAYLRAVYPFLYYGRGYPQLTWFDNYKLMGEILGIDLVNNPELALDAENSAKIIIEGMLRGSFTGLSLNNCVRYGSLAEFIYCRRIINGIDRDSLIAKYAIKFLESIIFIEA